MSINAVEATLLKPRSNMIRSGTLDALNAALSAAQGEFEAIAKHDTNPFFKSKYAPLPDVVKAATPILVKHGLAVWQGTDIVDGEDVLWTVLLHASGQYIGSPARMYPVKKDPQAQGSAVTYQRRYQYMAALGLVADEDDDGNAASDPKPRSQGKPRGKANTQVKSSNGASEAAKPSQAKPAQDALEALARAYKESGATREQYAEALKEAGAASTAALTEDQIPWVIAKLKDLGTPATEAAS